MVDDRKISSGESGDHRIRRRRLLKAGAMAVPVIVTLRARPAMAQINLNYENVEYRYGENAGKTSEQVQEERSGGGLPDEP